MQFINYQNKESKLAIFLAMEYGNDDNVKILLDQAPLLVFEKLHGKDKTVLTEIFENYPNSFAILLNNKLIAKELTNPIFFAEFLYEKDNPAYKLLISLKKQTTFTNKQLIYNNQATNHNNRNKITDALIDYKPKKKFLFNLDHMNIDSYYTDILNKEMSDLLHFILPKLENLAIYIKTKQYYIDSTTTNKTFSYGDENASITLINWLIYFGAKKIKVIISPPDTSTPNSRRYLSKIAQRNYNKQKLFCLEKLSKLFPAIKSDNIKPQKIILSHCNLHVGFIDDNSFMDNLFFNNKVHIKKHMHDIELLKYNGIVVSFSASETYKELVADDLIIIKPFAFAKKCEQIHTNLYIDKKNKSISADIKNLNNTPYSIIPEIKADIELKYNSDNHILKWLTANLVNNNSGANIANIINIIQLCLKQRSIDHSVIYGIHHRNIKGNEYNTIRNWITALDNFRYNRNTATVISIFPNNLLLDLDILTYNRNDIVFLSFSNTNIINNFKLAIAEKKIIIFNFPSLAKQIFYFLIRNSNLPMLTEGANTTSFLLQEGLPYLSLLPNFTTKIPYNIGNPLQSFLIEALSYKLVLNTNAKEHLTELHNLVKQKKFTEAQSLMDELIEQHNKQKSFLSYLWQQPINNPTKDIKFTAYKLITTGNNLSSNAYNILLQALANDFDSIANYIKQVIKTNSQEKEHIEIIKHKLQNNFNNAVITSLYKFFKGKNINTGMIK